MVIRMWRPLQFQLQDLMQADKYSIKRQVRSSRGGSVSDAGSIPGLAQQVEDLALPQAVVQLAVMAWILRCCGCGVGWQL